MQVIVNVATAVCPCFIACPSTADMSQTKCMSAGTVQDTCMLMDNKQTHVEWYVCVLIIILQRADRAKLVGVMYNKFRV